MTLIWNFWTIIFLVGVCNSAYAQDSQLITLEDGTIVRYFTEDQLRELATDLEEAEACSQREELQIELQGTLEADIENRDERISLLQGQIEDRDEYVAALEELIENTRPQEQQQRGLCRTKACTFAVGLTTGMVLTGTTAIIVTR